MKVTLPGGELTIDWRESDDHVLMTGPVEFEFAGTFDPGAVRQGGRGMSVDVVTFGCRLNIAEFGSDPARGGAAGLDDAVVVNTCAVTAEAVRQARQNIRRIKRERPRRAHRRHRLRGADRAGHVRGHAGGRSRPRQRGEARPAIVGRRMPAYRRRRHHGGETRTRPHAVDSIEGHTRAFVQVQNGCDHRCTFCIIPFGRGNSRSLPVDECVAQARRLVARGYREIVLTGVDITSYGADLAGAPRLGALVKRILKEVPELARLRLSSIDSVEADDDLLDAWPTSRG